MCFIKIWPISVKPVGEMGQAHENSPGPARLRHLLCGPAPSHRGFAQDGLLVASNNILTCFGLTASPPRHFDNSVRAKEKERSAAYLSHVPVAVLLRYPLGHRGPAGYPDRPMVGVNPSVARRRRREEAEAERQDAQQADHLPPANFSFLLLLRLLFFFFPL